MSTPIYFQFTNSFREFCFCLSFNLFFHPIFGGFLGILSLKNNGNLVVDLIHKQTRAAFLGRTNGEPFFGAQCLENSKQLCLETRQFKLEIWSFY